MGILSAISEADDEETTAEYSAGVIAYDALEFLRELSEEERAAINDRIIDLVVEHGPETLLGEAARQCPADARAAAFAWATDVALSDAGISPQERALLDRLQTAMGVAPELRAQIETVLAAKYAGPRTDENAARALHDLLLGIQEEDDDTNDVEHSVGFSAARTAAPFLGLATETIDEFHLPAYQTVLDHGARHARLDAAKRCPKELRWPAYVWSVEMILAAGDPTPADHTLLAEVQRALDVPDDAARRAQEVMSLKYVRWTVI